MIMQKSRAFSFHVVDFRDEHLDELERFVGEVRDIKYLLYAVHEGLEGRRHIHGVFIMKRSISLVSARKLFGEKVFITVPDHVKDEIKFVKRNGEYFEFGGVVV